jgi:hypothetical protein
MTTLASLLAPRSRHAGARPQGALLDIPSAVRDDFAGPARLPALVAGPQRPERRHQPRTAASEAAWARLGAEAFVSLRGLGGTGGTGASHPDQGGGGLVGAGGTGLSLCLAVDGLLSAEAEDAAAPARAWFARLEQALDRLLPSPIGTLLQLFVCVSLTMAMMSAMLPLIDRI